MLLHTWCNMPIRSFGTAAGFLSLILVFAVLSTTAAEESLPSICSGDNVGGSSEPKGSEAESGDPAKSVHRVERDLSGGWIASTKAYNLAGSPSTTRFKEHSESTIEIDAGVVFIEALKATKIITPLAEYTLKPKSLVFLRIEKGAEKVLAMLENVNIITAKRSTELRFGEEAFVTEHQPTPGELVGEEQLGIRQLRTHQVTPDRHIAIAEFSLIQATERIPLVSSVIHSGHVHDKALKSKLLKAAAVLNMVTSRHGYYSGGNH